jgi:hypothetical protein
MLFLLAAVATQHPVWWNEFRREYSRCGLVFHVEGDPAGDGVLIDKDYEGLLLSSSRKRPRRPIQCIAAWATRHSLKVRYRNF